MYDGRPGVTVSGPRYPMGGKGFCVVGGISVEVIGTNE